MLRSGNCSGNFQGPNLWRSPSTLEKGDPSPRDRCPENMVIDVIDVIVGGYSKLGPSCCAFFRWVWFHPAIEMSQSEARDG